MIIENNRYIREIIHNILLKRNPTNGVNSINTWLSYAEKHGLSKAIEKLNDSCFTPMKGVKGS